jgi:hypothetical protein
MLHAPTPRFSLAGLLCLLLPLPGPAWELSFGDTDFSATPVFSNVTTFGFRINIAGDLRPRPFNNPALAGVQYNVFGQLASGTPSGFPAFDLQRTIGGAEFYAQGSSLRFEVAADADLTDGLQLNELAGPDPVLVFNGREVGTGRYHPALLQLNSDGTGSIRNSNNSGGVNPGSGEVVDVDFGQEYITNLSFDPAALQIGPPLTPGAVAVPLPAWLVALGLVPCAVLLAARRARRQRG